MRRELISIPHQLEVWRTSIGFDRLFDLIYATLERSMVRHL
jgi:hypothetical protein